MNCIIQCNQERDLSLPGLEGILLNIVKQLHFLMWLMTDNAFATKGGSQKPNRMTVDCYLEKHYVTTRIQLNKHFRLPRQSSELPNHF